MKPYSFSGVAIARVLAAVLLCGAGLNGMAAERGSESHTSDAMAATYAKYGASQAVRAGDFLHIGGIVAMDEGGATVAPHDGAGQAVVIYDQVRKLLAVHGLDAKSVVSEALYITNYDEYWKAAPVRQKFYDEAGAAYPSTVGFQVVALSAPDYVFEVKIVAYVGDAAVSANTP